MPLTRHRIRNEYSLADSELYRAADKDDPEALLEGVAMAGLVGVLRQLGDLAEFAAEIFHDLHEEVMATATRGHGLVVRVQQLEAEFSPIEKAFLSQTSHSLTFYNTGVIWHPNLRMDQNLIVQGDLPRFVMDSYEECRGPPRLFLLDKFDVAGAGSCLKRYTDPSFFKVDSSSFGMMNSEVQRERKTRKAKKKGSRWRNGETPEVIPTSHAKLQQLFLEESVENYINDPARRVKLKRRLSGFPFGTKSGKSYMEKFLETSPTEHSSVHEISGNSSPLKLPEPLQRKSSPHSSPRVEDTRRKQSMVELREEVNYGISELTKPNPSSEAGTALSLHKELDEKEIMVDGERKIEGSANGYQFDDIASEVENYVDALTTMDAEMETDAECRAKDNLGFLNIENQVSDANEEQQGHQAHFSDDQSMGNSTATDDGNSSRKRISSFSYYDSPSNLAENMPSDGDLSARVFLSTEICEAEVANMSSDWCSANGESLLIQPLERKVSDGDCIEEAKTPRYRTELGEPSSNSCLADSATTLSPVDAEESLIADAPPEISSNHNELNTKHMYREEIRTSMGDNLSRTSNLSDVTSLTRHDILPDLSADNNPVDGLDGEDPHVLSHSSLHLSNILELASATKSSETLLGDLLQAECTEEECTKFLVDSQIDSPKSVASHREEQTLDSALPKLETCVPDVKPDAKVSEVDEMMSSEDLLGDMLQEECTEECTKFLVDSQIDSPKPVASHREEQTLGSALPELETCVPDVKPDSKVSEVDEMMSSENLVGDILHAECTEEECTKFSVDSQIDSPKSVASHIEEKTLGSALPVLETCVPVVKTDAKVEVDETKSSEDLLGDILQAECTEEECSKFSVDSQIDSSKSVASHREEQTLGSALPDLETCVPDVKSYGKVSEVDDAPQLSGEIASSSTPVVGNPQASNFTKQQFLEITEHVFPLEPDSEIGASYYSEGDLYGALNAADGEELRGFSSDIGMVGKNAANVEFPTDFQIITDLPPSPDVHLDVDDVETETIHSEAMIVANAVADTHDDDNRDSGRSLTTCPTKLQDESISISQDLRQNGLAIYEVCSPEHLQESGIEKKVDQQTVALSDLNSVMRNTVPCDDSKSELLNNVTAASMAALSGNSLHVVESHSDPLSSHQNDQDSKSKSHQQINVIANIEDAAPSPSNHIAEMRTPLVQKVELQADQFSVEYWHAGKESSEPPFQVEWIQSHNHLNQEGHPDASSEFCAAHLPCQTSKSEFLSQLDVSEQATEPSNSIFPSFGLLPEVAEINLDEMPPLPPLPPVQWRMGKVQHSSLAPERDLLGHNLYPSLQTFPLTADEKAELDHLATEGDITQPLNPLLPLSAAKVGNSQQGYENLAGYEEHATQLSLQVPTMVNCGNNEDDFPTSGRTQSTNTFLALPTIFNGRSQHGFLATEGGTAHATLNSFSPAMNVEDPISIYPPGSLQEKLIQSQHQLPPQTSSEDKKLQGTFVVSKGEAANPPEISFPQPDTQDDQPKHFFYYPEGETVLSSPFVPLAPSEDGKPNGIRQMKLPRPRNPLIDAVVAHDKSKLKKVTDLVRPKIGQELDERNSLLEEIRTKSFNLKPAVKTRPSNKGPKTNLKVAAILEKANAIRQALAGSDEDDDVDGWSDS